MEVILSSKIVKTDVNGKFTFNNIAEGKHVIVPSSNEYYFEPTYTEILLNSNIKVIVTMNNKVLNYLSHHNTTLSYQQQLEINLLKEQ